MTSDLQTKISQIRLFADVESKNTFLLQKPNFARADAEQKGIFAPEFFAFEAIIFAPEQNWTGLFFL